MVNILFKESIRHSLVQSAALCFYQSMSFFGVRTGWPALYSCRIKMRDFGLSLPSFSAMIGPASCVTMRGIG